MVSQLNSGKTSAGFTLIEVLIAVVVLSIGLLGLASLQLNSMQQNREAFMRTQALILAYDMADRMRANMDAVEDGDYDLPGSGAKVGACTTTTGCNSAQMASNDAAEWEDMLELNLPSGEGVVCRDDSPNDGTSAAGHECDGGGPYVIKVWWDRDRNGELDADPLFVAFEP